MANYFFTETAKFKPFTYQEMLAPIVAYKEAYDTNETVLNTLLEDAATKGFNFRANDTKEKAAYDSMIDRIKNAASSMATQGLNNQVFNEIKNINKDYRTTMIPIQKKLAKRQELIDEQRKLKASNQNLLFTKDYETASLDDITGDSTYNIVDLGKIIEDSVTDFTKFIASKGAKQGTPKQIAGTNSYMVETGYGYKENDWNKDITNPNSELYKQVNSYINDPRLNNLPAEVREQAKAKIQNAIYSNKGVFEQQIIKNTSKSDEPYIWLPGATQDEQGNITGSILTKHGKVINVSTNTDGSIKYTQQSANNSNNKESSAFKALATFKLENGNLSVMSKSLEKIDEQKMAQALMNGNNNYTSPTYPISSTTLSKNIIPEQFKDNTYMVFSDGTDTYVTFYNTKNDEVEADEETDNNASEESGIAEDAMPIIPTITPRS